MQTGERWREVRHRWQRSRRAERSFTAQLRQVARHVGVIVRGLYHGQGESTEAMETALARYAELLHDWARATAGRMLTEVLRRDMASWTEIGREINRPLRREIEGANLDPHIRELIDRHTELIKSLPIEAARRINEAAIGATRGTWTWAEAEQAILYQEHIAWNRAALIGRTEVGHATATLMEARGQHVGSPGYIWRTARDPMVRARHRELEGTFHRWDDPPDAGEPGNPMFYHAGGGPNCRCFPEVVIAEGGISFRRES